MQQEREMMKRFEKVARYSLFFIALTVVSVVSLKKITARLFAVEQVAFSLDPRVTHDCQQQVRASVDEYKANHAVYAPDVISLLQQQFPWIQSIAISYVPNNVMQVVIRAHEPVCMINHAQVLLMSGSSVEPLVYNQAALASLPQVTVAGALEDSSMLRALLQRIPADLLSSYDLEWVHETKVVLHDKQQRNFAIVCDSERLPDDALLSRCNTIKHDLEKKGTFTSSTKKYWAADVRFENQIVVSGGTYDGKGIS